MPAISKLLCSLAALTLVSGQALAAPRVVVSIKPIHAIAAAVMQGVAEPVLLLDAGVSEHTAQLKPSQIEALTQADLIVVVGENLEAFLAKALANPDIASKTIVELGELKDIRSLPLRSGGLWEKHDDGDEPDGGDDAHGHADPHIWMDPENARAIAAYLAAALSKSDPDNAVRNAANRDKFGATLDTLSAEISAAMVPLRDKRYIVFHDAYQYFEFRFDLTAAGSISDTSANAPSAKRLAEVRNKLRDTKAVCAFREPQFSDAAVQTLIEGTDAREGVLDPIGATLTPGKDAYSTLLANLAQGLTSCLEKG